MTLKVDRHDIDRRTQLRDTAITLRHDSVADQRVPSDVAELYEVRSDAAGVAYTSLMRLANQANDEAAWKSRYSGRPDEQQLKAAYAIADWLLAEGWTPPDTIPTTEVDDAF